MCVCVCGYILISWRGPNVPTKTGIADGFDLVVDLEVKVRVRFKSLISCMTNKCMSLCGGPHWDSNINPNTHSFI